MRGVREVAAREHGDHWQDQRQRQRHRNPELARQPTPFGRLLRFAHVLLGRGVALDARAITGAFDGCDELRRTRLPRIEVDPRRLGGEIDLSVRARHAIQHVFDPRCARRAGHSAEREFHSLLRLSAVLSGRRRLCQPGEKRMRYGRVTVETPVRKLRRCLSISR